MNTPDSPLKKALDAAAISAFAVVCASGLILRGATPDNARAAGILADPLTPRVLGLNNGAWASVNEAAFTLLLILLLPNLFWGWGKLARLFKKGDGAGSATRAAVGVISALSLIGALFTGFRLSGPAGAVQPPLTAVALLGDDSDGVLKNLTLSEAEKRMGVPADFLRSNFGLKPETADQPMSTLMKENNFTLDDVRTVVLTYRMNQQMKLPETQAPN